jgi:uncharacterized protein YkwD
VFEFVPECAVCGDEIDYPHNCNYCGQPHCGDHQLPENHQCPGLSSSGGKHFESTGPGTDTTTSEPTGGHRDRPEFRDRYDDTDRDTGGSFDRRGWPDGSESSDDHDTVGTTPEPEYEGSPPVQTRTDEDTTPLSEQTKSALQSGLVTVLFPMVLLYSAFAWVWNRRYRVLVVGILIVGGSAVAVSGPLDLGEYFGPQGERIDNAVTNASTGFADLVVGPSGDSPDDENTTDGGLVEPAPNNQLRDGQLNATVLEREIHRQINERRQEHGLNPLTFDPELAAIARGHSQDMVEREFYDHVNPDGQDPTDRYAEAGYTCRVEEDDQIWRGAENIMQDYWGVDTTTHTATRNESTMAEYIVDGWMRSEGHRENILKPFWRREGIGVASTQYEDGKELYVTQNFC